MIPKSIFKQFFFSNALHTWIFSLTCINIFPRNTTKYKRNNDVKRKKNVKQIFNLCFEKIISFQLKSKTVSSPDIFSKRIFTKKNRDLWGFCGGEKRSIHKAYLLISSKLYLMGEKKKNLAHSQFSLMGWTTCNYEYSYRNKGKSICENENFSHS